MSIDRDKQRDEHHRRMIRRTYSDFALSMDQRERHKQFLTRASRRPPRISVVSTELVTIAAVSLALVLAFVIWQSLDPTSNAAPGTFGGAYDAIATERGLAKQFHPPETCSVDAWAGPDNRLSQQYPEHLANPDTWNHSYFLDGSGISLNARRGVLYEGANHVFWLAQAYLPQDITYRAILIGQKPPAAASFQFDEQRTLSIAGEELTLRSATIHFPTFGCWQLHVTSQDSSLRKIIYVYPLNSLLSSTFQSNFSEESSW